jgi:hypothetical protein
MSARGTMLKDAQFKCACPSCVALDPTRAAIRARFKNIFLPAEGVCSRCGNVCQSRSGICMRCQRRRAP